MQIIPNKVEATESGEVNCFFNCQFCDNVSRVTITETEYRNRFHNQHMIQQAMPTRSATVREIFTSGICEECQKKVFG